MMLSDSNFIRLKGNRRIENEAVLRGFAIAWNRLLGQVDTKLISGLLFSVGLGFGFFFLRLSIRSLSWSCNRRGVVDLSDAVADGNSTKQGRLLGTLLTLLVGLSGSLPLLSSPIFSLLSSKAAPPISRANLITTLDKRWDIGIFVKLRPLAWL